LSASTIAQIVLLGVFLVHAAVSQITTSRLDAVRENGIRGFDVFTGGRSRRTVNANSAPAEGEDASLRSQRRLRRLTTGRML